MANADRLIDVFDAARALPAGAERERFLAEQCRGDPELKEQLLSLLQAHEDAGDFLARAAAPSTIPVTEQPGDRIGRYKLLERIGEGGCGVVYMAEQEEPVRRQVALKVIKLGMDTRQVIARFEAERQALALMDHPCIARVLDGGATDTGRPYFVMELVRGVRITDYCDQEQLSTRERLELFTQVCQAIQHAHQKGIIHRDIKPSNILVTRHDTVAVPKVIDFGISKAITGQLTDKTLFTAYAQLLGTPAYMSPEQARMSGLDIDTRTDIYSLGVLFYELLTGKLPFDPDQLVAAGLDEIRRIIREEEPPRPSMRLSTLHHAELKSVSARRHTEPPRLVNLIRGDLDWIAMKCLEKDRGRRYASASDLAMDLQRHLRSEPVLACPPSATYRLRKLMRRNRAAFVVASAIVVAMVVAVVALAISNRLVTREKEEKEAALTRALDEKDRADRNLSRAREAVKEFLLRTSENPLLQSGDFQELRRDLVGTAIPFYEEFVRQDREDPRLELERGRAYDDLAFLRQGMGDLEKAVADLERAEDIFRRLAGKFPAEIEYRLRLAEALNSRAGVLEHLGQLDQAEGGYREALALMGPLLAEGGSAPAHRESLARIQGNYGQLLADSGRLDEAEPLFRQAVAAREKLFEESPGTLKLRGQLAHSWNNLGRLLRARRRTSEAAGAYESALKVLRAEMGNPAEEGAPELLKLEHVLAQSWNNLGILRREENRMDEAEQAYREALAIKEKLAERYSSVTQYRQDLAASLNNLGTLVSSIGRSSEAEAVYRRAIQLYERLAADSPADSRYAVLLAGTYSNLGRLIGDRGEAEDSLPWLVKSIDILESAMRRDPRSVKVRETLCVASWTRAMTLAGLERFSEALGDWDRAIELDDGRYRQELRMRRASNLLQLKDDARAAADAASVAESPQASAEDLYNAACVYSLASGLASTDAARADSHAGRAVHCLRQAVARGFKDLEHMRSDTDLDPLRSRGDFQGLMGELSGSPKG